ncbi:MAG: AI-2E family transporter [Clostridiales bacterium]|nr:AI-2E family transporter [Clostridiales bacterium]
MKFKVDKRYLKFCVYFGLTCMAIYFFTVIVDYAPEILDTIDNIFSRFLNILQPIIVALIIAYLMFGPMKAIENFLMRRKHFPKKRGLCRAIGLIISYLAVIGIVFGLICGIYFMIGGQISGSSTFANIFTSISEYFETNSLSADSLQDVITSHNIPFGTLINEKMGDIANFITDLITGFLSGFGDALIGLGGSVFDFVISLVLSIYLLISYEYFIDLWNKFFFLVFRNSKVGKSIRRSLSIVNRTFSKYIHGQLIEAFLVFILSTIALYIVGIDYALVIGIICGVCNLIPYIGPFVGIVFAAIMALFSGNFMSIIWAVIALMIVQQIDANILCPNIVGDIVGLNGAFTLIAISIGGDLYGLLGMLIAVPVAASIKQIFGSWFDRHLNNQYLEYEKVVEEDRAKSTPQEETKESISLRQKVSSRIRKPADNNDIDTK